MTQSKTTPGHLHPMVQQAQGLMQQGRMDRREFVRVAALLGVSAGAAYAMAGVPAPVLAAENNLPFPEADANAKSGGILRVAMQVQKVEDPALFNWVEMGNQARQTIEYISITGPDNIIVSPKKTDFADSNLEVRSREEARLPPYPAVPERPA